MSPLVVTTRSAPNLTLANAEISGSAVAANTLVLLRRAAETGGLKLTATGNLSRAVVEEMCGIIKAPGYDKTELLRVQKVINEPDVLPLHFVHILAQAAKLIRTHRGKLIPTPLGRKLLAAEQHGPLQALLFHVAFWHMNLAYFDGYPLASWPLTQVGVILWSLRHRQTIGSQGRPSPGFARPRSLAFWSRNGTSGPARWRPHSPTLGLVRALGIAKRAEIAD